eukprot:297165-Prorocentrum_minimum.AAC.1
MISMRVKNRSDGRDYDEVSRAALHADRPMPTWRPGNQWRDADVLTGRPGPNGTQASPPPRRSPTRSMASPRRWTRSRWPTSPTSISPRCGELVPVSSRLYFLSDVVSLRVCAWLWTTTRTVQKTPFENRIKHMRSSPCDWLPRQEYALFLPAIGSHVK